MRNDFYTGYLMHHGIQGQKWGVRNGPPYPLDEKILRNPFKMNLQYFSDWDYEPDDFDTLREFPKGANPERATWDAKLHRQKEIKEAEQFIHSYRDFNYVFDSDGKNVRIIDAFEIPDADTGLYERKPYER